MPSLVSPMRTGIPQGSETSEPEQLQFKVIILGDGAVGKTSLCMRFSGDEFAQRYPNLAINTKKLSLKTTI